MFPIGIIYLHVFVLCPHLCFILLSSNKLLVFSVMLSLTVTPLCNHFSYDSVNPKVVALFRFYHQIDVVLFFLLHFCVVLCIVPCILYCFVSCLFL